MSIYPTLMDLCGIEKPAHVQGENIRALLTNPKAEWKQPAITTYRQNNHSIRSEDWRYTHYADDGEELYDETKDPYEWKNEAKNAANATIKTDLARYLPTENKPHAKSDGAAANPKNKQGNNKQGNKRGNK